MKISVVIPAYNEEKFIEKVISAVKKCEKIDEIIVVDNNSSDNTNKIAKENGAITVFCKRQGKGYAIEKGIKVATGDIIAFVDGDICNYKKNFLCELLKPIVNNEADFVKASFERTGGRVTELVAKPLIELLFPKLSYLDQPLSGIMAGKTSLLRKITLNKDYGVDVGILIDVYKMNAKIQQVSIGKIKNDSQDWHSLTKMAKEVAAAIISRSKIK